MLNHYNFQMHNSLFFLLDQKIQYLLTCYNMPIAKTLFLCYTISAKEVRSNEQVSTRISEWRVGDLASGLSRKESKEESFIRSSVNDTAVLRNNKRQRSGLRQSLLRVKKRQTPRKEIGNFALWPNLKKENEGYSPKRMK